ncbi:hypothetical protein [Microbacterium sp. SA39]|uniref:hypothetical protein n=1 Tax=Microbacterium sp. SA39 TaxID=1263625 RepID=UPI00061E8D35|nr:hypothetical protein [Microbacterium sp. SA39]KJQ53333.1 hypothetical protein RS85_02847 [Microbacterium sp. SA39]
MTRYGPYAETTPRGQTGWLDGARRPVPEHLRLMLGHLDGDGKYTYSIWRATNPESIIVTRKDAGDTFLQAAGSASAMTIEIRKPGPDGKGRLYTVGRDVATDKAAILIPINDKRAVRVSANEVFSADEAAAIFTKYHETGTLAEPFVFRELDLSQDQSVAR